MADTEAVEARIAKNKAAFVELSRDLLDVHAEDFRAKFNMDIANLRRAIENDENLIKEMEQENG